MTSVAFTIEQKGDRLTIEAAVDVTSSPAEDTERHVAEWLRFAVDEAIEELRRQSGSEALATKQAIALRARAAIQRAMRIDN